MKGYFTTTGVQESFYDNKKFGKVCIPEGVYYVEIEMVKDKISVNGDAMVSTAFVISRGEHQDIWIWDNIVISNNPQSPGYKILGRSMHFLHVINEPYEGENVCFNSENWIGKNLRIELKNEIDRNGDKVSKIAEYMFLEDKTEENQVNKYDSSDPFEN